LEGPFRSSGEEVDGIRNEEGQDYRLALVRTSSREKITIDPVHRCPQCHKRLDRSVIAVHAPRGEVTHYHCREAFAAKLKGKENILQPAVLQ
jgi:Vam6/Vps39-like protein vacuolar protein sorting-associated protein 39